ncbi:MAG: rod shape-determining protein MreD, partial [Oscillospiraceae bacterium]
MRILCYGIGLLILSVFQPTLIKSLAIYGITPNLFLIVAVIFGFLRGKNEGAIGGFVLGLVFDLLVGRFIGLNAILYMYIGFCTGLLGEYYFRQSGVLVAMI